MSPSGTLQRSLSYNICNFRVSVRHRVFNGGGAPVPGVIIRKRFFGNGAASDDEHGTGFAGFVQSYVRVAFQPVGKSQCLQLCTRTGQKASRQIFLIFRQDKPFQRVAARKAEQSEFYRIVPGEYRTFKRGAGGKRSPHSTFTACGNYDALDIVAERKIA